MNRQLLVLRHGKSDWDVDVSDFDRPLKKRGKKAAQRMGAWLREQNLVPDYIVSSPAERAKNTAVILAKVMGLTAKQINYDSRIYAAVLSDLKAVLSDCPAKARRVMLVGHNPGLEELLIYLSKDTIPFPDDGKLLPTATLAVLKMPDNWKPQLKKSAELVSITRPSELPETFPYYGLTGVEQRLKPAYYYAQSAAIPYRIKNFELQVLLISSSGKNHWGIPKGIIEPGLTASASAAIEAREEGGVNGVISEQMLGFYQYEKWGGTCTVQVYPMLVTEVVSDMDWEESHRKRLWLPLKKASSLIKQQAVPEMLNKLASLLAESKD